MLDDILNYIDAHLDAELDSAGLADLAGYSERHFARLFKAATGESVAHHLLKRRLRRALTEMARGTAAIDAVLRFGFDTYAGFYKAFVRMYGCSPRAYLRIYQAGIPAQTEWGRIIMPTKNELKQLLKHWPGHAGDAIHYIPIIQAQRMSDTAFRVGDDAVLKLYTDEARVRKALKLASLLTNVGLPASTAIPAGDGEPYIESNGIYVALVQRVPGAPLPAAEWFGPHGEEYAAQVGRALAQLHAALRAVEPDMEVADADMLRICADWAVPMVRKQDEQWDLGLGAAFFDDYLARFNVLSPKLPRQLIHRDPNPSNLLYENGQFSGFIDFDICERNARLFDVCYAATGILCECGGSPERYERWPELLRAIARGYHEIAPLTDAERASIFDVVCSIQFICCAYFESIDDPVIKALAATNRKMLMLIAKNRGRLTQE